ncbi:hypothetical protein [Mycobacterium sp. GA-2829]|uniref:DUF7064 domain-containing protein n=1 Tax=Mycobacterium sp. GA-2829 TaxID=1772283 RepID=UPI00074034E2|nr:hypothetical protein [Mycobacterium sp. GA-2829]KUI34202.1 hypothetical protein AU194_17790 [Mycobacterium sp. GA-2829]
MEYSRAEFAELDPAQDGRHRLDGRPNARESLMYMIQLPHHGLSLTVYTWVDAHGLAGGFFCAFGPAVGEKMVFESFRDVAMTAEAGFEDWRASGIRIQQTEPLVKAHVSYLGQRASIDFDFRSLHPAYPYSERSDGLPPFVADDRFEQAGIAIGSLVLDGRKLDFETWCQRDHSWGVRDWSMIQHWKWITAQAADVHLHVFEIFGLGRRWQYGYVDRDATTAPVESATIDFELDDEGIQLGVHATLIDSQDRRTTMRAQRFAFTPWPAAPGTTMHEVAMTSTIDGAAGVAFAEFAWPTPYLESMKDFRSRRG